MNYSKCVIYKICCNDLTKTDVYVGHTTDFINRKARHKIVCNNENHPSHNLKVYQYIRENGGWNAFSIIIIEEYPCNNFEEARTRERYWYETLNSTLNSIRPFINDEEGDEYDKQYRELNKERIRDNRIRYEELNKERIADYKKQYLQLNKEQRLDYQRRYRELNKERVRDNERRYRNLKKQQDPENCIRVDR
jgi:hypothetical protein